MSKKLHTAEIYAQQVLSGEVLVCELVQLAVKRYFADHENALERGWYFDRKAASRAIKFIESLKHTKGQWAGQRFKLEPWQQFVVWNIFGWKNGDGTRRFRYAYIEIAHKNGKTADGRDMTSEEQLRWDTLITDYEKADKVVEQEERFQEVERRQAEQTYENRHKPNVNDQNGENQEGEYRSAFAEYLSIGLFGFARVDGILLDAGRDAPS